jgi:hypothetical protein
MVLATATNRDYVTEMNAAMDVFAPDGDHVAADLMAMFADHLDATDPDLLHGFLYAYRVPILTEHFGTRRRTRRRFAARQGPRNAFHEAAQQYERHLDEQRTGVPAGSTGGDPAPLSVFAQYLVVNGRNLARPIGRMTQEDCFYVADQYGKRAKSSLLEEAFHRAVGERIPDGGVVTDVFTEETYRSLRDSIATL